MKILITGAHFTPAQALIEELKKYPSTEISYLGRASTQEGDKTASSESQVLPKLGVKFIPIITGRLQRTFTIFTITSLLKIPIGFLQSFWLILNIKPDVVVSFGGYTAVPTVISAWLLNVPILVHHQSLVISLSGKLTNLFADKVATSFAQSAQEPRAKIVVTGNPVRKELLDKQEFFKNLELSNFLSKFKRSNGELLLITGGNQGSHIINQTLSPILSELTKKFWIVHQTGESKYRDYDRLVSQKASLEYEERYLPIKWIDASDMGSLFRIADRVVLRGGINTLFELSLFQVPSLVIPLPYLYQDEQMVSARFFAKEGWLKILPQNELTSERLIAEISNLKKNLIRFDKKILNERLDQALSAAKMLTLETVLLASR